MLYSIGDVAVRCNVNPITLRAWQRRYGLLKPLRTEGGHRLYTEDDITRIYTIKAWIEKGVQVSKIKALLNDEEYDIQHGWRDRQDILLALLQGASSGQLRHWMAETGLEYPADTLINHLFLPLRYRLYDTSSTLHALLSLLDGVLIGYIALRLASAHKRPGRDALVVGWNISDPTRLWLKAWLATERGWRVDVLPHSLATLSPELFLDRTLLVWCGESPAPSQQHQLLLWQQQGHPIYDLGEASANLPRITV